MWASFIVSIVVLGMCPALGKEWPALVSALILVGGISEAAIFYRCPHCGGSLLDKRGGIPKHCPHCGEELK